MGDDDYKREHRELVHFNLQQTGQNLKPLWLHNNSPRPPTYPPFCTIETKSIKFCSLVYIWFDLSLSLSLPYLANYHWSLVLLSHGQRNCRSVQQESFFGHRHNAWEKSHNFPRGKSYRSKFVKKRKMWSGSWNMVSKVYNLLLFCSVPKERETGVPLTHNNSQLSWLRTVATSSSNSFLFPPLFNPLWIQNFSLIPLSVSLSLSRSLLKLSCLLLMPFSPFVCLSGADVHVVGAREGEKGSLSPPLGACRRCRRQWQLPW